LLVLLLFNCCLYSDTFNLGQGVTVKSGKVTILDKGEQISFNKNVVIKSDNIEIKCNRAKFIKKNSRIIATGNVVGKRVYPNNDYIVFKTENANYLKSNKLEEAKFSKVKSIELYVSDTPSSNTVNVGKKFFVHCENVHADIVKDKIEFFGDPISLKNEDKSYIIESKHAYYDNKLAYVCFDEEPSVYQTDKIGIGEYSSDLIYYFVNIDVFEMVGHSKVNFVKNN